MIPPIDRKRLKVLTTLAKEDSGVWLQERLFEQLPALLTELDTAERQRDSVQAKAELAQETVRGLLRMLGVNPQDLWELERVTEDKEWGGLALMVSKVLDWRVWYE